jgi:hypothetical protein
MLQRMIVSVDVTADDREMIANVKIQISFRQASQVDVHDVPQVKTFLSKGSYSSITPEDLSE